MNICSLRLQKGSLSDCKAISAAMQPHPQIYQFVSSLIDDDTATADAAAAADADVEQKDISIRKGSIWRLLDLVIQLS